MAGDLAVGGSQKLPIFVVYLNLSHSLALYIY